MATTTNRTSNKAIADKLDTLIELLIQAQVRPVINAETVTPKPVVVEAPVEMVVEKPTEIEIPESYRTYVSAKAQAHANAKGGAVIMYARRNLANQVKLAYCMADRFPTLKDRGLIGPQAAFAAE
jgi:hypothetical protein